MGSCLRVLNPDCNCLRVLLNEDDPGLKALVEEYLRGEGAGKPTSCIETMQLGNMLTADVLPTVQSQSNRLYSTSSVP